MEKTVPVIIPSYEPDERLITTLGELENAGLAPVVIVDDGSGDKYAHFFAEAAERFGAVVLRHGVNRGKGRALKTAFEYCLGNYPDLVGCVTADSDGQHSCRDIMACREAIIEDPDDLVLGVRDFDAAGVPAKSQFGNKLTIKIFKLLYKVDITDTQTGLRGISAEFMKTLLTVEGERFEFENRMLIKAVESGIPFCEIPIATIYDSAENHSTHYRPLVDSIRVARTFGFAFGRFVLSGLSSSLIDLALFHLFCGLFSGGNGDAYVIYAYAAARVISATYNYLVNYYLVFRSKRSMGGTLARYALLAACQMACGAGLVYLLVGLLHPSAEILVKLPVDVVLFIVNYRIQKKYVY